MTAFWCLRVTTPGCTSNVATSLPAMGSPMRARSGRSAFPRGRCSVERIVIRAPGGTISMEAVRLVRPHGDRDLVRRLG